jgi:hypothetical protein
VRQQEDMLHTDLLYKDFLAYQYFGEVWTMIYTTFFVIGDKNYILVACVYLFVVSLKEIRQII